MYNAIAPKVDAISTAPAAGAQIPPAYDLGTVLAAGVARHTDAYRLA